MCIYIHTHNTSKICTEISPALRSSSQMPSEPRSSLPSSQGPPNSPVPSPGGKHRAQQQPGAGCRPPWKRSPRFRNVSGTMLGSCRILTPYHGTRLPGQGTGVGAELPTGDPSLPILLGRSAPGRPSAPFFLFSLRLIPFMLTCLKSARFC